MIMPGWDLQQLIHIINMILTRRSAQHTAGVQAAQVFLFIVNSITLPRSNITCMAPLPSSLLSSDPPS